MSQSAPDAKLSPLDARVSLFHGSTDTTVYETLALGLVLQRIQDGTYRPHVERLRGLLAIGDVQAYKRVKATSVAFTPCCALTTRDKATSWEDKLLNCTGLVHFDIDELDAPEALKAQLLRHPSLVFAFTSPSGHGLKLGYAATPITGPDDYKQAWQHSVALLKAAYPGLTITEDRHVKFLHALCFVSHDPSAYVNDQATPLQIPPATPKARVFPTSNEYERPDYARVTSALAAIPDYDDYDTWVTVGMALHSAGEPWARSAWDSWSQRSDKYNEREQGQTWQSFHADGKVTLGTVFHLAKQHGWQPPSSPRLITRRRSAHIPDMTQPATPSTDDPEAQAYAQPRRHRRGAIHYPPNYIDPVLGPRASWCGLPVYRERILP